MTRRRARPRGIRYAAALIGVLLSGRSAFADSPELSLREFASGQIKKGVRSIGFGGDGATWGNYALVWKDAGTTLVDYGDTSYSNGNDFRFAAIGATPALWHDLVIYVIAMDETTNELELNLKSPGLGLNGTPVRGEGGDQALFSKIALPLAHGFSAGVLLAYETSHFDATALGSPQDQVRYDTTWRPSGGLGLAWQPSQRLLFGFRALLNNDREHRSDALAEDSGLARSAEYRLGASIAPWTGALIDLGGTRLEKHNSIADSHTTAYEPNIAASKTQKNPSVNFASVLFTLTQVRGVG